MCLLPAAWPPPWRGWAAELQTVREMEVAPPPGLSPCPPRRTPRGREEEQLRRGPVCPPPPRERRSWNRLHISFPADLLLYRTTPFHLTAEKDAQGGTGVRPAVRPRPMNQV